MNRTDLIGQTLGGRYRIEELIGQGGMSAVYRGYDPNLHRVVAIKTIKPDLASDQKFLARFDSEAKAVAQLRHENIVQVYDFAHDDGLYYMVQEFVPGETLQNRLKRLKQTDRDLPIVEAIQYTIDVSKAAGYAHRRGMIHRDIKPANIIVSVNGPAILMDFGIVKITGGLEHTVAGALIGTALYMPPELIRGEVPDARSDIYSLGVTLYEMLSGHAPYEADSAMTLLMMHLQDPIPDVRKLRPDVPPALSAVIARMLAKDRNDRYASMADLADALEAVLSALRSGAPLLSTEAEARPVDQLPTELLPGDEVLAHTPPPGLASTPGGRAVTPPPGVASTPPGMLAGTTPESLPPLTPPRGQTPVPGALLEPGGPAMLMPAAPARRGLRRWSVWLGAAVLLLAVAAGVFLLTRGEPQVAVEPGAGTAAAPTAAAAEVLAPTGLPEAGPGGPQPQPTSAGSTAGTPGMSGHTTATAPTDLTVNLTGVTLQEDGRYRVDFALSEPVEEGAATLHFYFNTVRHDQAGAARPYAGASPFIGYTPADRPQNAWEICALVAGADGTAHSGSGNCALLPDVPLVTADETLACFFGPGEDYPAVGELKEGEQALLRGLSADELWWNVTNPQNPAATCWVSTLAVRQGGDISQLPLVDAPPPGAEPSVPAVAITAITVDADNRYVVDFAPANFVPAYPGTHVHFFFNTFTPDQVGIGGEANRLAHGGGPPFTGFAADDRPESATQMCVLVANPDHSVLPGSGNCFDLPNLPSVRLTEVVTNTEQHYVADFEMTGFVPQYPGGMHIHFFFNTFDASQVGIGGQANRLSHGGGPPFSGFAVADRPPNATQLCALVANPNHQVLPNSGNCLTLPGLPTAEITRITADAEQRYVVDFVAHGFEPVYPGGTHLHFFFNTFTPDQVGIGGEANRLSHGGAPPFTGFTAADLPPGATQLCLVVANPDHSVIPNSGNCLALPDVLGAEITGITIDAQNRYVVEYVAHGFVPKDPGTHIHFYFDTVAPEDLSKIGVGHRYSHGGGSPFAAYSAADRPEGATKLCAVVINPDGSAVPNSGNCFALPDAPAD